MAEPATTTMAVPNVVDWAILAVGLVSVFVGAVRGFLREALSLVIWVAALIMASLFADALAEGLARWIASETLRYPLAFAGLFLGVLLIGAVVQYLVGLLVQATGLTGLDRVLGTLFGILRALVLLVVVAAVLDPMFEGRPWWQESIFVPHLLAMQEEIIDFLRQVVMAVASAMGS